MVQYVLVVSFKYSRFPVLIKLHVRRLRVYIGLGLTVFLGWLYDPVSRSVVSVRVVLGACGEYDPVGHSLKVTQLTQ